MQEQDVLYWSKRLYEKGMSPSTTGNISIKTENGILISASGVCLNDMDENDLILIDFDGNVLDNHGTKKKPSSEKFLHIEIYEKREDIKAIIHSHCPFITAFAVAGIKIESPILAEFVYHFDKIPLAPYAMPSTYQLAEITTEPFKKGFSTVLMKNHGVVTGADTLKNCFYNLEALRAYCETYFGAAVLGGAKNLNAKQINEIQALRKTGF